MGTDIHVFAESREGAGEEWRFLPVPDKTGVRYDTPVPEGEPRYRYYDKEAEGGKVEIGGERSYLRSWISDRNYRLFAYLADVRNGYGFAGVDTGEPVQPFADPRGWPQDLSPELREEEELIEHDPTWFTVQEIQDFFAGLEGDQEVVGVMSARQFEALEEGAAPESYSAGIYGRDIITLEQDEYLAYKKAGKLSWRNVADEHIRVRVEEDDGTHATKEVYVRMRWRVPKVQAFTAFNDCMQEILDVAKAGAEDVRVLIYFDS